MEIYLMKTLCPICDGKAYMVNGMDFSSLDDECNSLHDLPLVEVEFKGARFDECVNGHRFNIRPYGDYDKHYVYEDELLERYRGAKERYHTLSSLIP